MQISEKYGLVYVITKLGLLFVYDLQTATAVYRNRISPDPIFLTANSPTTGGFYAVNRWVNIMFVALHAANDCSASSDLQIRRTRQPVRARRTIAVACDLQ